MKLFIISAASFVMQRQLRNSSIGVVTRIVISIHTVSLLVVTFSLCLLQNQELLKYALITQAIWQQLIVQTFHLRLNRFNHLEEQEQIRRRFGLTTKHNKESPIWYYRRIVLFQVAVLILYLFSDFSLNQFLINYMILHILLQIHQGSITFIEGIKQLSERNRDYINEYEGEGLIVRNNLMLKKVEDRRKQLKKVGKFFKTSYFYLLTTYIVLSIIYELYAIFTDQLPFDLLDFLTQKLNLEYSAVILWFCEFHVFVVILFAGNSIMQKKANRVKRLYENVRKEQEKLSIEGGIYFSAMIYLSLALITLLYFNSIFVNEGLLHQILKNSLKQVQLQYY